MIRDEHYWMGSLAMTVAMAATSPDPKPVLRSAMREFLRDRPPGCELAQILRTTLKEKR